MKVLALCPKFDTVGKHDATGAFQPEALSFVELHGGVRYHIDNSRSCRRRREEVIDVIEAYGPDVLAVFCHGWRSGIQFGFGLYSAAVLASTISNACGDNSPVVAFYCCSTADGPGVGGDGGFADALRDGMCRHGARFCSVDAHDRAGHCSKNPFVRRFLGNGSFVGGTGGQWIVAPDSALWSRWRAAMKTDLRLRYPIGTLEEIHKELIAE